MTCRGMKLKRTPIRQKIDALLIGESTSYCSWQYEDYQSATGCVRAMARRSGVKIKIKKIANVSYSDNIKITRVA